MRLGREEGLRARAEPAVNPTKLPRITRGLSFFFPPVTCSVVLEPNFLNCGLGHPQSQTECNVMKNLATVKDF